MRTFQLVQQSPVQRYVIITPGSILAPISVLSTRIRLPFNHIQYSLMELIQLITDRLPFLIIATLSHATLKHGILTLAVHSVQHYVIPVVICGRAVGKTGAGRIKC